VVELDAKTLSKAVEEGFQRIESYRKARALFVKDYVGQYMMAQHGLTGDTPINLVYLAIHALVPNLVQKEGMNKVLTDYLAQKDYAELLGLALDKLQKQLKMRHILRSAIIDMCFGFAIAKTSIAADGMLLPIAEDIDVPLGSIYTDLVSLDDFTFDPTATAFDRASFLGHRIRVPRQQLLDYGWEKKVVEALPKASEHPAEKEWAKSMTQDSKKASRMYDLQDFVYVVETYVPNAEAIIYVPDPQQMTTEEFLHVQEYVGPDGGPYTFGSLTQPVPDNPFPIAPVGVWRDLSAMACDIFKKFMDQADRQKDILLYPPAMADVADAIRTAPDGSALQCSDPKGINVASFGGQNPQNEAMVQNLRSWFNYMAGNPDQLMGVGSSTAETATEFQGNQANATVRIEDMRDIVCDFSADISSKQAWYLHTDPLMFNQGKPGMPLIRRVTGDREVQVWLTPEQRSGDWLDFTFEIVKRSMTVVEPQLRAKRLLEFCTNVIPAVTQSAMVATQMGIEFNAPRLLMQIAEEMGISEVMQETFQDPTFEKRLQYMQQMGPQDPGKGTMGGVLQNGGLANGMSVPTPQRETNQLQQGPAGIAQSAAGFGGTQWQ